MAGQGMTSVQWWWVLHVKAHCFERGSSHIFCYLAAVSCCGVFTQSKAVAFLLLACGAGEKQLVFLEVGSNIIVFIGTYLESGVVGWGMQTGDVFGLWLTRAARKNGPGYLPMYIQ
jgi:hypothetical protein